ncbi:MAG: CBS domain-containing protein [Candidatus Woesearchaeota archaeon]
MQTGYKVMDVMTNKPITALKTTKLFEAAKLMAEHNINSILIVDGDTALGIVTDEDIVRHVVAKGIDPKKILLKDIMSEEVVTINPEKDIYNALIIMRDHNIRQLPVMEKGKLIGFLTLKDILKIQPILIDLLVEKYEIREPEERKAYQEDFFPELKDKKKRRK